MALDEARKRRASSNFDASDRDNKRAKTDKRSASSGDVSKTALDTLFILLKSPENHLYKANVGYLIDAVTDSTSLQDSVTQPLTLLQDTIRQMGIGKKQSLVRTLLSAVEKAYFDRVVHQLVDYLGSDANKTSQDEPTSIVRTFDRFTVELTVTPVVSLEDSEGEGQKMKKGKGKAAKSLAGQDEQDAKGHRLLAFLSGDGESQILGGGAGFTGNVNPASLLSGLLETDHGSEGRASPQIRTATIVQASIVVRDAVDYDDQQPFEVFRGSSNQYAKLKAPEASLALRLSAGPAPYAATLDDREVRSALSDVLPADSGLEEVLRMPLTVPDLHGIRKGSDLTYLLSFGDGYHAQLATGLTITLDQSTFLLERVHTGPHQTYLCQYKSADENATKQAEIIRSVLSFFHKHMAICVQTATNEGEYVLVTLGEPVSLRHFAFNVKSHKNLGHSVSLSFFPLVEGFDAACAICDFPDHETKACPKLCTTLLETSLGLHPRVKASIPALQKQTARLSGDGLRVQSMSLPHRSKSPHIRAMATAFATTSPVFALGEGEDAYEPNVKVEPGSEQGESTTAVSAAHSQSAWYIQDHARAIKHCACLRGQFIVDHSSIPKPKNKLALQMANGAPVDPNISLSDASSAIFRMTQNKSKHKISLQSVKRHNSASVAASFGNRKMANHLSGRTFMVGGQDLCLAKISQRLHQTYICDAVPFGLQRVSRSSLLHGLLHLLPQQAFLRVRMASAPANEPSRWLGAVLVILHTAQPIQKFGFELQLLSGNARTGILHTVSFEPYHHVQSQGCRACFSRDHTTNGCQKLVPTVLETSGGAHPRTHV